MRLDTNVSCPFSHIIIKIWAESELCTASTGLSLKQITWGSSPPTLTKYLKMSKLDDLKLEFEQKNSKEMLNGLLSVISGKESIEQRGIIKKLLDGNTEYKTIVMAIDDINEMESKLKSSGNIKKDLLHILDSHNVSDPRISKILLKYKSELKQIRKENKE